MPTTFPPKIRKPEQMAEPTSTSAAAGYAFYKFALAIGFPAILASAIVMLMARPRSSKEWAVCLISTLSSSIYGGAFVARHYGWHHWALEEDGFLALGGVYLLCGLPTWVAIRLLFAWADKRKDKDLADVFGEIRTVIDYIRGR